jgi:hypothetical protein
MGTVFTLFVAPWIYALVARKRAEVAAAEVAFPGVVEAGV